MKMVRHYFISDNLEDLELFEEQLEVAGVATPQIHVLSSDDAEVEHHEHLHEVQSFMKKDVVHSTEVGAVVGLCAFALVLAISYFAGWTDSVVGWTPFVFLALIALGFCTWEGGLIGIERPNHDFERFAQALGEGKHIFFVDLEPAQEAILDDVLKKHPQVELAGTGASAPRLLMVLERKFGMLRHS